MVRIVYAGLVWSLHTEAGGIRRARHHVIRVEVDVELAGCGV